MLNNIYSFLESYLIYENNPSMLTALLDCSKDVLSRLNDPEYTESLTTDYLSQEYIDMYKALKKEAEETVQLTQSLIGLKITSNSKDARSWFDKTQKHVMNVTHIIDLSNSQFNVEMDKLDELL